MYLPRKYSFLMPLTLVYLIDPISFHRGNIRNEFSSIEIFPPRVIGMSRNSSFQFLSYISSHNLPCKFLTAWFFFIKFYIEQFTIYFVVYWVQQLLAKVDALVIFKKLFTRKKLKRKILSSSKISCWYICWCSVSKLISS